MIRNRSLKPASVILMSVETEKEEAHDKEEGVAPFEVRMESFHSDDEVAERKGLEWDPESRNIN